MNMAVPNPLPERMNLDPHLTLWQSMWNVTKEKQVAHPRYPYLTTRQRSEWMLRQLCANCRAFVGSPAFWIYFHRNTDHVDLSDCITGELFLFTIFANEDPDKLVRWIHDKLCPDDPDPASGLDPADPHVTTITI